MRPVRGGLGYPARQGRARRARRARLLGLALLLLLALGYLAWPYVALWRLDRALARNDRAVLAALVDLHAVRAEVARRLNKELKAPPPPPSDDFIAWLERGIRRDGAAVLERRIDLEWVRALLLSRSPEGRGMVGAITRAFFDGPLCFSVRLGAPGRSPVHLRLGFNGVSWRVTAVFY